jgi:O-succinylbenzoic acid--CoA ligase
VRVVATYGSTETCGGCVYDGVPLDGVRLRIADVDPGRASSQGGDASAGGQGRVLIGGPTLARGYRDAAGRDTIDGDTSERDDADRDDARGAGGPGFVTDLDGARWLATDDAGRLDDDGQLEVLGRLDDVVVTGGLNVAPPAVESALLRLPGVREAVVLAAPDPQWGQRVVAAVVLAAGATAPTLAQVRERVAADVAAHAAPRQLLVLDEIPVRGPGKPDRSALARLAEQAGRE